MPNRLESLTGLLGMVLVIVGAGLFSWRAAVLVAGLLFLGVAIWPARPGAR